MPGTLCEELAGEGPALPCQGVVPRFLLWSPVCSSSSSRAWGARPGNVCVLPSWVALRVALTQQVGLQDGGQGRNAGLDVSAADPSPRCSGEVRTQCHSAGALCPQEGTRRGAGAKPTCPSLPCEQSCSRQTPGSRRHLGNACCKAGVKDMPEERPAHPHSHRSHSHCCPDTHTEDGAARDCGGRCGCFEDTPRGNSEGHSGGARPPSCRRETQSRNQRVWCQTVRAERPLQGVAPSSQEEGQGLHRAHSQVHGPPPTGGQSQGLATAVPGEAGQLAVLCRVPAAAPRPVLAGPAHVSRTGQPSGCLK